MFEAPATGPLVLALATGAISVLALRTAWRRKGAGNTLGVAGGWGALAVATLLWCHVFGVEFGISYSLAWFAVCACVAVLLNRQYRKPQADTASPLANGATSTGHKWLTFITAGPVALVTCVPLTLLLTMLLPLGRVNQMALAAVLFPILWALAAYWASARDNPGRIGLLLIATAIISYLCLTTMDISA